LLAATPTSSSVDVTADQTVGFLNSTASALVGLVEEYEAGETLEARLAHEADKLECVFQAREYQAQRAADTTQWIESCSERISSATGRQLLHAAAAVPPNSWWQEFQDSYNQQAKNIQKGRTE
jgi:putative hydrolase of HD superfamily